MSQYSSIKAAVNAYIKQNGRKEITGNILNAVLNATIDSLGKFYQFAGVAVPTTDPENPDQNVCYLAGEPGTYTHFDNIVLENEEIALLFYNGTWTKQRMLIGIQEVTASVDNQVGTPSVDVSYSEGQLVLTFHNLKGDKGDTGDAAGFGTIGATVDSNIGTPGVSVQTSGTNLEKNIMFNFTNLKGETGVTSVIATVDNTVGTPSCTVSLVGQQLTLAFTGLKGLKGDTGVSADYPITIYNGLDSTATDQALSAYQGKVLKGEIDQLEQEVDEIDEDITVAERFDITPTVISNLRMRTGTGKVETSSGYTLYYIPVIAGKYYNILFAFNSNYVQYGYTTEVPANGVSIIDGHDGSSSTDNLSRTMAYTGYFCFSFVASSITTEPTAYITNDGIGANVSRLETQVTVISQKLIKLKWMGTSGSLDPGEYGYRTDTKKIRYNNSGTVEDVPFYPDAVYTYNNEYYVYNGDTLISSLVPILAFSNNTQFEAAVRELYFSGFDSTFVGGVDSFKFAPAALNGVDYIRLIASGTTYSFRSINDGKSGVFYFRLETNTASDKGRGIYVLLNRDRFVSISTNAPISFNVGMVLNVSTMPTIREFLTGLTTGDFSLVEPSFVATKKGIGMSGVIEDTTNASFTYTVPVQVKRGDIIQMQTDGNVKFAAIAKTNSSASFYHPVVAMKSAMTSYTYIVDEDGYVAFTIFKGDIYYIRKVSSDVYAGIKNAEAVAEKYDCSDLYISRLSFNAALTYSDLMGRYDALIAKYPDFMTKTKIGESENGQDLFEIIITNGNYNNAGQRGGNHRDAEIEKPKFLIGSGIHGYEPGSPNSLYLFVRELVEGNPALSTIRNNVELRIIPCMNPDGYDARTRTNHNGVDLNRNFNYNWVEEESGTPNYSGPSAASESETQAIQGWIDDNTDAVFCIDWHQSSFNEEVSCLGGTNLVEVTGQTAFKRLYLEAVCGIAGMLISRRGASDTSIFAYTYNDGTSDHGRSAGYIASKGLCGGTLETQENFESSGNNSALTISVGADIIGNLLKKAEKKYGISSE